MITRQRSGAIALITIVIISAFALAVIVSASMTATRGLGSVSATKIGEQTFDAAEAGIQDALYRLGSGNYASIPTHQISNVDTTVTITPNGFHPLITSVAHENSSNTTRTIKIVANSPTFTGFSYAIATGTGGFVFDTNSTVNGDVYANGPISKIDDVGHGHATLNGNVWLSGGNTIEDIDSVTGDAHVQAPSNIEDTNVTGTKYFDDPPAIPYPIQDPEIQQWKDTASAQTADPNYDKNINGSATLGPVRIKSLTIGNHDTLTVTGVIYATENVTIKNGAVIQASLPVGTNSVVIISDKKITVENGATFPSAGGYIMLISTHHSTDIHDEAISASNLSDGIIYYAKDGVIGVTNNGHLNGAIAESIHIKHVTIDYDPIATQLIFSTNPGSGQTFGADSASWQEL